MSNCSLNIFIRFYYFIFLILFAGNLMAQKQDRDFSEVLHSLKKDTVSAPSTKMVAGKNYTAILPLVGYGPAYGFVFGAAANVSRLLGISPTKLSAALINFQYTTKKQFIFNVRTKFYLPENKWFIQGDWRLLLYAQPTYGLGLDSKGDKNWISVYGLSGDNTDNVGDPMNYNQIRFYEEGAAEIGNSHIYAGVGIAVDQIFGIVDKRLNTNAESPDFYISNHYAYSNDQNFNPEHYGSNGLKFSLLTDTRDNIVNAYSGYYVSVSMLYDFRIKNNSQQSTQFLFDGRYYLGLSKNNPRHLIAFWTLGSVLLNGKVPYLALPSIGWDTYNRSGRGFVQGRYRGLDMIYNESEYRFPVTRDGLLGGVLFVNATSTSNKYQQLFDKTAFGYGGGIRMKFNKLARINLSIDYGWGTDQSHGIYFNLQETF